MQAMDYTVMVMPERFATGTDPESTIRRCLWSYPTLFQSRTDVLRHLFLTIGNGYKWDGCDLVSVFPEDRDDKPSSEVYVDPERFPGSYDDLRAERDEEYRAVRSDIERAATTKGPLKDDLRTGHYSRTYSYLWNSPEEISPEWTTVLAEARELFEPLIDAMERKAESDKPRIAALQAERRALQDRIAEIDRGLMDV
jgi:hypothetical protein